VSALKTERVDWRSLDVERYYAFARERGARRLVITGGGEPLLRPDDTVGLIERGARYFDEIACFTNGARLTPALAARLADAGLSYLCYSRHSERDDDNRTLMGTDAPALDDFFAAASGLKVRATCVMVRGHVDSTERVWRYIDVMRDYGVTELTFKHTYVAYDRSVFAASDENRWARDHKIEYDPFADDGGAIAALPWGPVIRRIRGVQVCYYHEPTPAWEKENRLCRSTNLLSDGAVYASLEDRQSQLFRLMPS
jgi:cyclic pyranopterin phosphate synthase